MKQDEWKRILCAIEAAERQAAQLVLSARDIAAENKSSSRDVVTEYDRRVQRELTARLQEAAPEARFFCEELGQRCSTGEGSFFIIDPIDGTMNFVHGFHHSCLSVAYAENGQVCAGAVYDPYHDEMFTAVRGCGARLNGRPLCPGDATLAESVACFGTSPYDPDLADATFALARRVYGASLDLRREGSAALDLCSVAAGRAGLYFELHVSLWDYAAGALIVQEAGRRCLTDDGRELPFDASRVGIAAGAPTALADYLRLREL